MKKNFVGAKRERSEKQAKSDIRERENGSASDRDIQTPRGEERTTMLISMTSAQKIELQTRALQEGVSAAALVRDALISAGYITAKE